MSLSLPKRQCRLKRRPEDAELAAVFGARRCGTCGDIRWPEDAELTAIFGARRCGTRGDIRWSEDVELAAVLIVGAEGLECFGSHTEDEVVGEDRVVVLEYGCDLTLGLAFQVKAD